MLWCQFNWDPNWGGDPKASLLSCMKSLDLHYFLWFWELLFYRRWSNIVSCINSSCSSHYSLLEKYRPRKSWHGWVSWVIPDFNRQFCIYSVFVLLSLDYEGWLTCLNVVQVKCIIVWLSFIFTACVLTIKIFSLYFSTISP